MRDPDEMWQELMAGSGFESDIEKLRRAWIDATSTAEWADMPIEDLLLVKDGFYRGYAKGFSES